MESGVDGVRSGLLGPIPKQTERSKQLFARASILLRLCPLHKEWLFAGKLFINACVTTVAARKCQDPS